MGPPNVNHPNLSGRDPRDVLRWAWDAYGERLMTTTAFGYSGMALLHMMAEVTPGVPIYFVNTGFHFPETLEFRDFCRERLGLNIIELRPEQPAETFLACHGHDIMQRDPHLCCAHNISAPLRKLLDQKVHDAWITARRGDQVKPHWPLPLWEPQRDGPLKIHPLAAWTREQVWQYIHRHNVPTHPLHEEGYREIGCAPCAHCHRQAE